MPFLMTDVFLLVSQNKKQSLNLVLNLEEHWVRRTKWCMKCMVISLQLIQKFRSGLNDFKMFVKIWTMTKCLVAPKKVIVLNCWKGPRNYCWRIIDENLTVRMLAEFISSKKIKKKKIVRVGHYNDIVLTAENDQDFLYSNWNWTSIWRIEVERR